MPHYLIISIFILLSAAIFIIDLRWRIIPDFLNYVLLWTGLIVNINGQFCSLEDAVLGAILGYIFPWLIYWGFKILTKKEAMGYGDFKLLAAMGAWFGWQNIPFILLLSCALGIVICIILKLLNQYKKLEGIPFAPCISAASWLILFLNLH